MTSGSRVTKLWQHIQQGCSITNSIGPDFKTRKFSWARRFQQLVSRRWWQIVNRHKWMDWKTRYVHWLFPFWILSHLTLAHRKVPKKQKTKKKVQLWLWDAIRLCTFAVCPESLMSLNVVPPNIVLLTYHKLKPSIWLLDLELNQVFFSPGRFIPTDFIVNSTSQGWERRVFKRLYRRTSSTTIKIDTYAQQHAVLWVEHCKAAQNVALNVFKNFCRLTQHVFLSISLRFWLGHSGAASGLHVAHRPLFEQVWYTEYSVVCIKNKSIWASAKGNTASYSKVILRILACSTYHITRARQKGRKPQTLLQIHESVCLHPAAKSISRHLFSPRWSPSLCSEYDNETGFFCLVC